MEFDYIQALNEIGDMHDFNDGLDGWFDFTVADGADAMLTATFIPWDEAQEGPGEPMVKRYRLTPLDY